MLVASSSASADVTLRVRGADGAVRSVSLEPYVERSVAAETYASWPIEALKAQAVVARSYALHQRQARLKQPHGLRRPHDLEASVLSQRYVESAVASPVRAASRATAGEFLSWEGAPILAAFHSSAGGRTAAAEEVWGLDVPYLRPVDSPDDAAPDYFWSLEIGLDDLRGALGEHGYAPPVGGLDVRVEDRSGSGRAQRVHVLGLSLSGRELRQVLGGRALRSALFDVRVDGPIARFLGSGAGHGVGLCQWGARELARRGRSYTEILSHYYPGTALQRLGPRVDVAAPARH
jgi:stage II sporulation protein D